MASKLAFVPNDPFKPSIQYGVKQVTTRRPDDNDLYASPKLYQKSQRHAPIRSGAWDDGWGTEGWGHSRDDPTYPSRPDWIRLNHRMDEDPPVARPGWRKVQVPRRKGKKSKESPERHPVHETIRSPTWMTLPNSQRRHAAPESVASLPYPRSYRRSPSHRRTSHSRDRSPHTRPESEPVYSLRSPESLSLGPQPQPQWTTDPWRPPLTSSTTSSLARLHFELARPMTDAPLATPAMAESVASSHRSSLPFRYSDHVETPHAHARARRTPSDIQIVPSVTEPSDEGPPRGRVRLPRVFTPTDDDQGRAHSIPPSYLPTPSPRVASPLSSQVQKMDWERKSSITSWFIIDDPPALFVPESHISTQTYVKAFVLDTLPRQLYTYALLRLPHMYFSRVTRIFEEAELSMPQIKQGIVEAFIQTKGQSPHSAWMEPPFESVAYSTLSSTWEGFIDSVLREWKTLNIISVLLLSAILTMLQLEGAGTDPLIRFTALLSMVCALMSLLYGCMFIIRFGTMRKTYKAAEWANEAQQSRTGIFWNVWVLLAMPATWLAWSMILYIISIMSFIWRTGTVSDGNRGDFTARQALAGRITVSVILALGLIYFFLILGTLKRYGDDMDRAWQQRISGWISDQKPQETLEKPLSKPVYLDMPAPHSWATWIPDPNTHLGSIGDAKEKDQFVDQVPQVPTEDMKYGFEGSLSTSRNEFISNWLVGQHGPGSELSLPNDSNPFVSAVDMPSTAPQLHNHTPTVFDNHVAHSSDGAPEIRSTRLLLRPASPLQITVNAGCETDREAILSAYNVPDQLSGTIDIDIQPVERVIEAEASFDRPGDFNIVQLAQQGLNLVYMTKILCLQDTSVGVNVFPRAYSAVDGIKPKSLPYCGIHPPDHWQELERDIRLSWTPNNFSPVHQLLQMWNSTKLRPQNIQMALCKEVQTSGAESLSIYSLSSTYPLQMIDEGAFVLPPYLRTLEIFTQPLLRDDLVPEILKIEWDCQAWVERDATD